MFPFDAALAHLPVWARAVGCLVAETKEGGDIRPPREIRDYTYHLYYIVHIIYATFIIFII